MVIICQTIGRILGKSVKLSVKEFYFSCFISGILHLRFFKVYLKLHENSLRFRMICCVQKRHKTEKLHKEVNKFNVNCDFKKDCLKL